MFKCKDIVVVDIAAIVLIIRLHIHTPQCECNDISQP